MCFSTVSGSDFYPKSSLWNGSFMLQQIGAKLEDFFDDSTIPRFGSITVNNSPDGSLAFKITKLPSLILFDKYFSVHF